MRKKYTQEANTLAGKSLSGMPGGKQEAIEMIVKV